MKKLFIVLCFCFSYSLGQETLESVRRQTKAVEVETAREAKLHDEEKKRHADFIETGRKKVLALNAQNQSLRAEMDSMKTELTRLQEARQKTLSTARWYDSKKIKYQESLALAIDSLKPILELDFPYKVDDAVNDISEIASQLKKGHIAPTDALARTIEVFLDRIRLGYTTEVWKGSLALETRSIPGTFMRYGAVASVFMSLDGSEVFWLSRSKTDGYVWQEEAQDMELRSILKEVLKVAEGKTAPKIVQIPVYLKKEGL